MSEPLYRLSVHDGPIVATAIHDGTDLRAEIASLMELSATQKLYEEDPHTSDLIPDGVTALVVKTSRFEVDMNRPRETAVYATPEQAWGLHIWKTTLSTDVVERSLALYDEFYSVYGALLRDKIEKWGSVVVLDVHSYNHRRDGADGRSASADENPEVNLGTRTVPSGRWDDVITTFTDVLAEAGFDVRENVKFGGGNLGRWTHETFPGEACVLSVEFKKVFMDEWTGVVDQPHVERIRAALGSASASLEPVLEERSR